MIRDPNAPTTSVSASELPDTHKVLVNGQPARVHPNEVIQLAHTEARKDNTLASIEWISRRGTGPFEIRVDPKGNSWRVSR